MNMMPYSNDALESSLASVLHLYLCCSHFVYTIHFLLNEHYISADTFRVLSVSNTKWEVLFQLRKLYCYSTSTVCACIYYYQFAKNMSFEKYTIGFLWYQNPTSNNIAVFSKVFPSTGAGTGTSNDEIIFLLHFCKKR